MGLHDTPARAQTTKDISALYDRINLLERRCCTLQKKLNARPAAINSIGDLDSDSSSQTRPVWEPWLTSKIGPRTSEFVVLFYTIVDAMLQSFTRRLLQQEMWRWVFYGHLLVLYTFSASFYAQAETADLGNPVDKINVRMAKAATDAA